jgi:hypothetical protein
MANGALRLELSKDFRIGYPVGVPASVAYPSESVAYPSV